MTAFLFLFLLIIPGPRLDRFEHLIFPQDDGFTIITKDSIYHTVNGKDFTARRHYYTEDFYRLDLVPSKDSQKFFIANGGGLLVKFEDDTLKRVDQSYRWRSRYNSLVAAANDTVYLFGGYGEFTYYNDLLRFDESTREWSELPVQEPRPSRMSSAIGYLDLDSRSLYVGFGADSRYVDKRSTYRPFYNIGRFDLDGEYYETIGSMEFIQEFKSDVGVKFWKSFPHYKLPIFYSNRFLFTFDFKNGKAQLHDEADYSTIEQFSEILAYNPNSNKFLIGGDLTDIPRYLVINELDLLGRHYTVFEMKRIEAAFLERYSLWITLFTLVILLYLFSGKKQQLIDLINQNQKRVKLQLSDEDFNVLQIIIDAYPNFVDYPELQNSFERELSYESRIKKLRTTIKTIDDTVQSALKIKGSVFEIEKGKEDKRVKVIRLKDQIFKFSKLRSFSPF